MRTAAIFAFILMLAHVQTRAAAQDERPPQHLVAPTAIWDQLDKLADTATVEHARCLLGAIRKDTAYVDRMTEVTVALATDTSIVRYPCPAGAMLSWHNHINKRGAPDSYMCFLSSHDFITAIAERAWFVMVQVNGKYSCWWSRPQILSVAYRDHLWPYPGQVRDDR